MKINQKQRSMKLLGKPSLTSASGCLSLAELGIDLGIGTMTLALLSLLMPLISHSGSTMDPADEA